MTWGRDISRLEWIRAALAAEDAGRGITSTELYKAVDAAPAHARRIMGELLAGGYLIGDTTGLRVGAAGRAADGRPILLYVATGYAAGSGAGVLRFASRLAREVMEHGEGLSVAPHMPDEETIDRARAGDQRALVVMTAIAQRSDVVVVMGNDKLALENRSDVVAAERRGVPVVSAIGPDADPVASILIIAGRRP